MLSLFALFRKKFQSETKGVSCQRFCSVVGRRLSWGSRSRMSKTICLHYIATVKSLRNLDSGHDAERAVNVTIMNKTITAVKSPSVVPEIASLVTRYQISQCLGFGVSLHTFLVCL